MKSKLQWLPNWRPMNEAPHKFAATIFCNYRWNYLLLPFWLLLIGHYGQFFSYAYKMVLFLLQTGKWQAYFLLECKNWALKIFWFCKISRLIHSWSCRVERNETALKLFNLWSTESMILGFSRIRIRIQKITESKPGSESESW